MGNLEKVPPMIRCSDYWPKKIPQLKLMAYKWLLDEGQITKPEVTYNKTTGSTLVSYLANQPHEWVRERMKQLTEP